MNFVEVKAGESQKLGPFKLDFVEMRHSIPEALGLYVETDEAKHFLHWRLQN